MFDFIWNISFFIIAIGILVTFHEYGHFWVARKCNVKVERFSIGFGKALWRRVDKHGTEFVIAAIPLGGYVKMLDERVDDVQPEDRHKTFNAKSVYQRIAIIAAGPLANFLLAAVAFYFVFLIGSAEIKPVIGGLSPASIAETAKLPKNSIIVEIDGRTVRTWQEVNMALVSTIGNESVVIKTKSFDTQKIDTNNVSLLGWNYEPEKMTAIRSLGLVPFIPKGSCVIAEVVKGSAAELHGLIKGDVLVELNGDELEPGCSGFSRNIQKSPNADIALVIIRNKVEQIIPLKLGSKLFEGSRVGSLGVQIKFLPEKWPESHQFNLTYGVFESVSMGLMKTWDVTLLSFKMIGKLVTGDISAKNLSGPIGIAQGAGNSAGVSFVYFLSFIAFFSINLGIFNLLPLPVLDGGHLLYYLIELLTGKPVPDKVQEVGFRFGAIALFSLMAFALLNDISRL